jgi:hypothetical protein
MASERKEQESLHQLGATALSDGWLDPGIASYRKILQG